MWSGLNCCIKATPGDNIEKRKRKEYKSNQVLPKNFCNAVYPEEVKKKYWRNIDLSGDDHD